MYEVFARLIDQDHVVGVLQEAVAAANEDFGESQAMTHAWLFTGPPGSGRSSAALAFAAALVCASQGCGTCADCLTALAGTHADVEQLRTEGLSIRVEQVRELIQRASWFPSVAKYRVVVIEDADRLTESAANALLKAIEEPGSRTVWLLCAPSATDVLPTIRSRTRSLVLRTPSARAVAQLLIAEGCNPSLSTLAVQASQGHVGRARQLATQEAARESRSAILKLPLTITDLSSAFLAASKLVDAAKRDAEADAEARNEKELAELKEAWGQQGSRLVAGGSKAVKELEKEQKSRSTRLVRDYLDRALLDIATFFRDVLLVQSGNSGDLVNSDLQPEIQKLATSTRPESTIAKLEALMETRNQLSRNANSLLAVEALMVQLR